MNPVLDAASTWFFDSLSQSLDGTLAVRLVEGIKGAEREYLEVDDTRLGPYFPVSVQAGSQCVLVSFPAVIAFVVVDESFADEAASVQTGEGRVLAELQDSAFRAFAAEATSLASVEDEPVSEFVLRCEDRVIHVLARERPRVHLLQDGPDLSVARTQTWSAS